MGVDAAPATDRRHRRREETIREIVDVAVELMGEHGAAGLSLGDVARRMGIRTPSLYGYFDSKNALYDAVFERGWRQLGADAGAALGRCPTRAAGGCRATSSLTSRSKRRTVSPAGASSTRRTRS